MPAGTLLPLPFKRVFGLADGPLALLLVALQRVASFLESSTLFTPVLPL